MLDHLTGFARYVELLMQAMLIACFFRWSFSNRYRWFMAFIFAELVRSCVLFGFDNHSTIYAEAWSFTQPVMWILQLAAVLELMLLVYRHRPAAGRFARRLFVYYIPSALLVSVIVSLFESSQSISAIWWLLMAITVTKWLSWMLLFMLVAQEVLHLTDSQPMGKELVLHRRLMVVYVGLTPGLTAIFALLQDTHIVDVANFCSEISWVICLVCWIVGFRQFRVQGRAHFAEELG